VSACSLGSINVGESAVIQEISGEEGARRRMQAMGLRTGREARVVRRARMGGPIQIRVGNVSLILRRGDAERVLVSRLA
jgi:ferrous iron transport protein A